MPTSTPRNIGTWKQLMLDESIIESQKNVTIKMNPAVNTGEVLIGPESDAEHLVFAYSSVLKENGRVRVWYDDRHNFCTRYAESDDGLHFTKPELNLVTGPQPLPGNAVIYQDRLQGCAVWIDPNAPPEEKYKTQAKFGPHPDGRQSSLDFHSSPDGLHWKPMHSIEMDDIDVQNVVFWDESYGRYVMYTRRWIRLEDTNLNNRKVRRMESDDLVNWDSESVVWEADEADNAIYTTSTGMPPIDYYGAEVYKYPDAGDLYIILAEAFWHWKNRPEEEKWGFSPDPKSMTKKIERLAPSTMDVRLGYSLDGKLFHRAVDRGPFISLGPDGRFDSKWVWALPNPVVMGDELWIYYAGHNLDHDSFVDPAAPGYLCGIGRAVMRLDGFVSADTGYDEGELVTNPFVFEGDRLELNVRASGGGSVRVEVQDETGKPMEGFSQEDSELLIGDSVAMPWGARQRDARQRGDGKSLGALAGRPVKLRFIMRESKLYAFRFQ